MFMPKKDESMFVKKFKENIPAIIPIYAIPMIAGLVFFGLSLSYMMLICVIAFAVNSYAIAPLSQESTPAQTVQHGRNALGSGGAPQPLLVTNE